MKDIGQRIQTGDDGNDIAIKVEHVSKTFRLPHNRQNSLKGSLINLVKGGERSYEKQEVLKDVSFEIKKGEFFGIVGRNGSGKSTLLKMLAGIYKPTKGKITVNGSLTPFIELGVGFNPELTGRENVFLNGALLGFSNKDVEGMYDDIVAFAELERFMDQKLKNYSSGMQVRLAFSIAIRARSDILLLDEVLAVGDEAFQEKCIDIFEKYKAKKQTIVLVTHDMSTVKRFCSRAMLIQDGEIVEIGDPTKIATVYSKINQEVIENVPAEGEGSSNQEHDNKINITILKTKLGKTPIFNPGEVLEVSVAWTKNLKDVKNIGVIIVKNSGEIVYAVNTFREALKLSERSVHYRVKLNIGDGKYHLMAGLFGADDKKIKAFEGNGPQFIIRKKADDVFEGIAMLDHEWST